VQNTASIATATNGAGPATSTPARVSPTSLWLFWLIASAMALLPLLASSLAPLDQHFFNVMRVEILTHPAAYAERFAIHWGPIPDLAADLVVPVLAQFMPLSQACDLFLIALMMLLTSGTVMLNRAVTGRWSVLPLASFLLLYNWILIRGYENNLFGLGLTLCAVVIYFCHLFPLAEFGVVIGTWELGCLLLEGWSVRRLFLHGAAALVPFIVPLLLLIHSSTGELSGAIDYEPFAIVRKIKLAVEMVTVGDRASDLALLTSLAIAAAIAVARGWLRIPKEARLTAAVLCVLPFLVPITAFASFAVTERCVLGFAFVLLALLEPQHEDFVLKRLVSVALVGVFLFRIVSIAQNWEASDKTIRLYQSTFATLKPGSVLMQFKQDVGYPSPLTVPAYWNPPLSKIVALATEDGVLVPQLYLKEGQQPVVYQPRYAPLRRFQLETDARTAPVLADDATLRQWLAQLRQTLSHSNYQFSAVYVAVLDPNRRLDAALPGARLIATLPGHRLYQLLPSTQAAQ
jgi:hypothetical protein